MPTRQWVLTFPIKLRWVFARRPALAGRALGIFLRALATYQRQRARIVGVNGVTKGGAITFVQRFNSALGLNIHFHVVTPDGVFTADDDGKGATFHRLPAPRDDDVEDCSRRPPWPTSSVTRRGRDPPAKKLTANLEGFSLHAGVHIHANDRLGLERLCRYGARGAIAHSRLEELPDGRVSYHMKRPLPDGRTHLVMTGMELLRKLAPLVPPPKIHLLRFHGVFAPNAKLRRLVVPKPPEPRPTTCKPMPVSPVDPPEVPASLHEPSPYRLNWAEALKRVWGSTFSNVVGAKGA